jgi:shikimate kinase
MLIFLIGFMASGKSYVGKKLAAAMDFDFHDLDDYIEKKENLSVTEIFEKKGEAFFRQKESEYLADFLTKKNIIVATGGGCPCFFDNIDKMLNSGLVIYLFAHNELIFKRLRNSDLSQRPLLKNKTDEELRQFITEKVKERSIFYDRAEAIFEIKEDGDRVVEDLLFFLKNEC